MFSIKKNWGARHRRGDVANQECIEKGETSPLGHAVVVVVGVRKATFGDNTNQSTWAVVSPKTAAFVICFNSFSSSPRQLSPRERSLLFLSPINNQKPIDTFVKQVCKQYTFCVW